MDYTPHSNKEIQEMLSFLGVKFLKELYNNIPDKIRQKRRLNLPDPLSEIELLKRLKFISDKNVSTNEKISFLGAGNYDHFIPSVVNYIISKPEFYTSYTPYQPELSQGILQSMFEYQTIMCELTGMDISNISLYDGATAIAEAANMALSINKKKKILISETVHPEYHQVLKTYKKPREIEIIEIPMKGGITDKEKIDRRLIDESSCLIISQPNFFGNLEPIDEIFSMLSNGNTLAIACVNPLSLALLKPPADFGADIVVGDGQVLGNPQSFGGPSFGFLTCKKKYLRKIPGRIVGQTVDSNGKIGYVLTLQTREQHIRREKATSNICSNQSLNVLAASVYLSYVGRDGFLKIAELCYKNAHYLFQKLIDIKGINPAFNSKFFNEFTVHISVDQNKLKKLLSKEGILGPVCLEKWYPSLKRKYLFAVTEKRTKEEMDLLIDTLNKALKVK